MSLRGPRVLSDVSDDFVGIFPPLWCVSNDPGKYSATVEVVVDEIGGSGVVGL